jgi:hypothetical protein
MQHHWANSEKVEGTVAINGHEYFCQKYLVKSGGQKWWLISRDCLKPTQEPWPLMAMVFRARLNYRLSDSLDRLNFKIKNFKKKI